MYKRDARFAYSWYPGEPEKLKKTVGQMLKYEGEIFDAKGVISPHAGIVYSGNTAGGVYARIKARAHIIILSPNHTGIGETAAIIKKGEWRMPNGNIEISEGLAEMLIKGSDSLNVDERAHSQEHSIELQLPFLIERFKKFKLVPVTLKYLSYNECEKLGKMIARVIKKDFPDTLIVASSDMSHGETLENTNKKDMLALEQIKVFDAKGLYETVSNYDISMCGFIPAVVMLVATKELGAKNVIITQHTNSYEISRNKDYIVGYAGVIVY